MSKSVKSFKQEHSFEKRREESGRVRTKYPDRIPIIVETIANTSVKIDKKKFLVPADLTMGQLVYVIRKRVKLAPDQAIFIFNARDNSLPPAMATLATMDKMSRDEDGFVYFTIAGESTFGSSQE